MPVKRAKPDPGPGLALGDDRLVARRWAVVDVETTGGSPAFGDRITEFAAVIVEGGRVVDSFASLVNPQRSIPVFITRLTGISRAMVRDQPTFAELAPQIRRVLGDRTFVAHNAGFDWKFVNTEITRATGLPLRVDRLCTVRLSRRLLSHLHRRTLDSVCRYYGVEITDRHRALGDALATARVLLRLLDDAGSRGCDTWEDLDNLLTARTARSKRRRRRTALPHAADSDHSA